MILYPRGTPDLFSFQVNDYLLFFASCTQFLCSREMAPQEQKERKPSLWHFRAISLASFLLAERVRILRQEWVEMSVMSHCKKGALIFPQTNWPRVIKKNYKRACADANL